jgi:hypothetical protein
MNLPLLCHLILIKQHVTSYYKLFTYKPVLWAIRITVTEELALQHLREGESALLGWTQLDYSNPSHNVVSPSALKIIKHIG